MGIFQNDQLLELIANAQDKQTIVDAIDKELSEV